MIWDTRKEKKKQQPIRTRRRKKNPKMGGQYKQTLGQLQEVQHSQFVAKGEEKGQEIGILFEKNSERKHPYLVQEIDMQVQEAECPKQDGCKETHSKTYHNQNFKVER